MMVKAVYLRSDKKTGFGGFIAVSMFIHRSVDIHESLEKKMLNQALGGRSAFGPEPLATSYLLSLRGCMLNIKPALLSNPFLFDQPI